MTKHIFAAAITVITFLMLFGNHSVSAEVMPLDVNRCWPSCMDCERRCSDESCKENCHDNNASCCEANGKQGTYKSCGCH